MTLHISSLIEELSVLPEQDSASMRLLSLLNDPDSEARDIAPVIEADPSMTARILTLSNSAFFAMRSPVTNPWAAVMVLGFNVVRALAASGCLGLNRPGGSMPKGFYEHSIASAAGAAVVARHSNIRPADAFSAGLLHDVGAALLFRARQAQWQEMAQLGEHHQFTSLAMERRAFGASHDELGAAVLDYLHFPSSIIEVVRHHNDQVLPGADPELNELTRVVIVGVALAEDRGFQSTSQPIVDPQSAFDSLGIAYPPTDQMVAELHAEIDDLKALLR